ncbi:putative membrane protein [Terribacillus aidingensis]|uniref:Putative membrane protein n=1 Tax=Terribacillus aidingensis TaxID=586416 RepID=A0A285P9B6_9BACI|nr:PH domain-containing protein [Terribacillus aidingensis]SNZ16726.1 putative membrane protein [Terribacillus aidingensis]
MSEPKRMHPISIVLQMLKLIKDAIIPLAVGFIAFFRNLSEMFWWSPFALIGAVLLISGLTAFLHWYRFTYRIEADELRLESGVFVRKKRYISKHRIQSVNTSANILHRLFGIVKLEVQTAGGGKKAEGEIGALSKEDAAGIQQFVKRKEQRDTETDSIEDLSSVKRAGYTLSFRRLLAAAATSGGTGVFFGFLFAITQQLDNIADFNIYSIAFDWLLEQSLVLSILFVIGSLALTWMIAMVGTVFKYCYFQITKQGEELFIRRGLLEKREITIPLHRIQALKVEENIFRQPFGLLAVSAVIAGGGAESDKHSFSTILFPLLKRSELQHFLKEIVPGFVVETAFRKPPKRARLRYAFVPILISMLITGVLVYFFSWYGLFAILFILLTVCFCVLDYKDAGVSWTADMLTMRYRELSRITVHVPRKKVQAFRESQHYFQSKKQLGTVKISVASGGAAGSSFKVRHLAEQDAQAAADWYSFRS